MRAIVQRVKGETKICSKWSKGEESFSFSGPGFVVLLGWEESDLQNKELDRVQDWLLERIDGLRVFPDSQGRMNLSLGDYLKSSEEAEGGVLWVPQFTLAAELKSGFRPSFIKAMNPDNANKRFNALCEQLKAKVCPYRQIFGRFGAEMDLQFTNWGPVTIPFQL